MPRNKAPDGARIATVSVDGCARIWDAETGHETVAPLRHGDRVRSATWSPDALRLITASWDRSARVWDTLTGTPLSEPMMHDENSFFAAFHPNGCRAITACNGSAALLWEITPVSPLIRQLPPDRVYSPQGDHSVGVGQGGLQVDDLLSLQSTPSDDCTRARFTRLCFLDQLD